MDYFLDTFEDDRLEEQAREWTAYLEDCPPYAEEAPSVVRASLSDFAAEVGLDCSDPCEGAALEAAVERATAVLGRARGRVSDLKARAILHSPPQARRRVRRLTRTASHSLIACDYPDFLEALATGQVTELRERANRNLERLSHAAAWGGKGLESELERHAAIVAACELALEALAERDPERLREAEQALQAAIGTGSQTRTRAYSRPRRRGPCSTPSRHLAQAVLRSHAPPRMRDGNHVEGAA